MLRLVLNSAGIFITSILNSLSRRLPWVLYFLQGFSIFQLRVIPLSSLYLHFCIYGFRWKLPLVTLKACPYMGASLYRLYPGYVGHHHRGAGGAEPLQGWPDFSAQRPPPRQGQGSVCSQVRVDALRAARSRLFLQGVSPSSCSGAAAGARGAQVCTGICAPAHTRQRHVSPMVVVPDLVKGEGVAWVGEGQLSWELGTMGSPGSPAVRGLAASAVLSANNGRHPSALMPGPDLAAKLWCGVWCWSVAQLRLGSLARWPPGELSLHFVQWSQHLCAPCGSS